MQDRKLAGLQRCNRNLFLQSHSILSHYGSFYYFINLENILLVYCKFEDQARTRVAAASKGIVAFRGDFYLEEATSFSVSPFCQHWEWIHLWDELILSKLIYLHKVMYKSGMLMYCVRDLSKFHWKISSTKGRDFPTLSPSSVNIWNITYLIDCFEVLRTNSYL